MSCIPWEFPQPFDYIHVRSITGGIGDWAALHQQAFLSLNPRGLYEIEGHDFMLRCDDKSLDKVSSIKQWLSLLHQAAGLAGRPLNVASKHKEWMKHCGFACIEEEKFRLPIGTWMDDPKMKAIGQLMRVQMALAVPSWTMALFTRHLGWSAVSVESFIENVLKEILSVERGLYISWYRTSGRRE
ncbi:hypothetical protein LTR84_004232 [Exophiala bonariae]|uniref:Methyltransferase n=1 Tax=Exophiala bonariae TaxID=1690606 RepID=A0AAV9N4H3_9EURO|nr:hypothetical protein LTR84_004232 [Exophiala bonariae]